MPSDDIVEMGRNTLIVGQLEAQAVSGNDLAPHFAIFHAIGQRRQRIGGTIDNLVKPENISKLQDILEYHVYVGVIRESMIQDKLTLNQVNGKNVTLAQDDRGLTVNDARIVATVQTSNGIIYVIDKVLLP